MNLYTPICVDVNQVMGQWHMSRTQAYALINDLNRKLLQVNPQAITPKGRVNKEWYDYACSIHPPYQAELSSQTNQ